MAVKCNGLKPRFVVGCTGMRCCEAEIWSGVQRVDLKPRYALDEIKRLEGEDEILFNASYRGYKKGVII